MDAIKTTIAGNIDLIIWRLKFFYAHLCKAQEL